MWFIANYYFSLLGSPWCPRENNAVVSGRISFLPREATVESAMHERGAGTAAASVGWRPGRTEGATTGPPALVHDAKIRMGSRNCCILPAGLAHDTFGRPSQQHASAHGTILPAPRTCELCPGELSGEHGERGPGRRVPEPRPRRDPPASWRGDAGHQAGCKAIWRCEQSARPRNGIRGGTSIRRVNI